MATPLTGETLTNHEINEYFGQTVCYPRDVLKELQNYIYVINSDNSSGKGKHWVAWYNGHEECFYFDSFRVRPLPEVESVINKSNKQYYYNTYRIQDFDSNKCGYFCISFLENVHDYESFHEWSMQFDVGDFKKNDNLIMHLLKK